VLAIRIFLAGGIVQDLLAARERTDDAKAVHPAGKIGDADILF
jgi:hypothetical protein